MEIEDQRLKLSFKNADYALNEPMLRAVLNGYAIDISKQIDEYNTVSQNYENLKNQAMHPTKESKSKRIGYKSDDDSTSDFDSDGFYSSY